MSKTTQNFSICVTLCQTSCINFLCETTLLPFRVPLNPFRIPACVPAFTVAPYNWQPTEHLWRSHHNHTARIDYFWQQLVTLSVVTISARSWFLLHTSPSSHRCSVVTVSLTTLQKQINHWVVTLVAEELKRQQLCSVKFANCIRQPQRKLPRLSYNQDLAVSNHWTSVKGSHLLVSKSIQ